MTEQPAIENTPAQAPATDAQPEAKPDAPAKQTETPSLGDAGKQAIDRMKAERDDARRQAKANADAAKKLKEIEDRDLSELEKAKRDATEAAAKLATYEVTTLRQRVALEKGLPAALVGRLQGSTEAEVSADADALLALIPNQAPQAGPKPNRQQGQSSRGKESSVAAGREMFSSKNQRTTDQHTTA